KHFDSLNSQDNIGLRSILGACRTHNDIERAERIGMKLIHLYPKDASPYVLLGNIYRKLGRNDEADKVRKLQKKNGANKTPGITTIYINGTTISIYANDREMLKNALVVEKLAFWNKE